jgi:DNA-binding transcriptional LysR family regulator
MRSIADVRMDEQGIHRDVVVRTDHQLLVPSLIEGSSTVAIVPERLARLAAGHTRIKIVEAAFDLPSIDQIGVWHPSRTEDPAILWLVQSLLAHSAYATSAEAGKASPST